MKYLRAFRFLKNSIINFSAFLLIAAHSAASAQVGGADISHHPFEPKLAERQQRLKGLSVVGNLAVDFQLDQLEQAEKYRGEDLTDVVAVLKDPLLASEGGSAALLLGFIGNLTHVPALIHYIEREEAESATHIYMAKGRALEALGLLAGRTHSQSARDYLAAQMRADLWANRSDVKAASNTYAEYGIREIGLRSAVIGYALAGSQDTDNVLSLLPEKIQRDPGLAAFLKRIPDNLIDGNVVRAARDLAKSADQLGPVSAYLAAETEKQKRIAEAARKAQERRREWENTPEDERSPTPPVIPVH